MTPDPDRRAAPPNIIFIHCDSMDGRLLGCLGHPAMKRATPHLEALAQRGTLFRNAYCNAPLCVPSRASMWSGQFTHHCGGWNNFKGLEQSTPTFETSLEERGYQSRTFGKLDYLSGDHTIRARVSAWTRSANIPRPNYHELMPRIMQDDTRRVHAKDWEMVDNSLHWLRQDWRREDGPLFLYLGLFAPHSPFVTSQHYLSLIDADKIDLPAEDEEVHPVMRYQRQNKNWEHGFSPDVVRQVRHVYFAMIAELDALVGEILDGLQENGLGEDTYLIFSSDHGELAMEHRQVYKSSLYEPAVRVPLIVTGPQVRRGASEDALVSLVDIYPTLMDMAGAPHPAGLDGHSLLPRAQGKRSTRPDGVFAEYHDTSCNTGCFMVRRGQWKYIAYPGYEPMLFDLQRDPGEVSNQVASEPAIAREMDELLRGIVDYEAVDARIKAHDREQFRQWRQERRAAGDYQQEMARVFSGWDDLSEEDLQAWSSEDERLIEEWLATSGTS